MSTDTNWKIARNEAAVRAFLKGWDNRDVEACMALVTDDMCYLNQPLEAIRGVNLSGERVLVQRYGETNLGLEEGLEDCGADVVEVPTYRNARRLIERARRLRLANLTAGPDRADTEAD